MEVSKEFSALLCLNKAMLPLKYQVIIIDKDATHAIWNLETF